MANQTFQEFNKTSAITQISEEVIDRRSSYLENKQNL